MKYRLKNRRAQAALDEITGGAFTKELDKDIEYTMRQHGSLEEAMEEAGYVAFFEIRPDFARYVSFKIRLKDIEEAPEREANYWHPDEIAARRYVGKED